MALWRRHGPQPSPPRRRRRLRRPRAPAAPCRPWGCAVSRVHRPRRGTVGTGQQQGLPGERRCLLRTSLSMKQPCCATPEGRRGLVMVGAIVVARSRGDAAGYDSRVRAGPSWARSGPRHLYLSPCRVADRSISRDTEYPQETRKWPPCLQPRLLRYVPYSAPDTACSCATVQAAAGAADPAHPRTRGRSDIGQGDGIIAVQFRSCRLDGRSRRHHALLRRTRT